MSAALTSALSATATPLFFSVPAPGSVVILTAARWLAGLSLLSLKPKSVVCSVYAVSSLVATVLSAPAGASLTELIVIGTGVSVESSLASQNVAGGPQL